PAPPPARSRRTARPQPPDAGTPDTPGARTAGTGRRTPGQGAAGTPASRRWPAARPCPRAASCSPALDRDPLDHHGVDGTVLCTGAGADDRVDHRPALAVGNLAEDRVLALEPSRRG